MARKVNVIIVGPWEHLLLDYLIRQAPGRARALTAAALAGTFQTTERVIRDAISRLRTQGCLVASSPTEPPGYYIPRSMAEAEECRRHLWSRVRAQAAVARAFDAAIARTFDREITVREQVQLAFGFDPDAGKQTEVA